MKEKILKMLLSSDQHLSGEAICQELGISRTAVWKYMNKLKQEGYQISSIPNKGYLLTKETWELIEERVTSHIKSDSRFTYVKVLDSIDSTNDEGKRLLAAGLVEEGILIAREQLKGKGRRGRLWLSDKNQGIFMSLLLRPDLGPNQASMLTLLAGLAVVKAIEKITDIKAMIKWPNDVVVDGKKICGILTEMSAEMDYIHYVVVGIGINVNNTLFEGDLIDLATSLKIITGEEMNKPELIGQVVEQFELLYNSFLDHKDLSFILEAYNRRCVNIGQQLKVVNRTKEQLGIGVRVTKEGFLCIKDHKGEEVMIHSGEVSVRGLNGYV